MQTAEKPAEQFQTTAVLQRCHQLTTLGLLAQWVTPRLVAQLEQALRSTQHILEQLSQMTSAAPARIHLQRVAATAEDLHSMAVQLAGQHELCLARAGMLLAWLVNDLQHLLTVMRVQVLMALAKLPSHIAAYTQTAELAATVDALLTLSNRLCVFACRESDPLAGPGNERPDELCDLTDLMRENLALLAFWSGPQHTLRAQLAPLLPLVNGRINTLRRIVMELLINAFEALAPEGGEVFVHTATDSLDAAEADGLLSANTALAPGSYVRLTVRDTGTGMSSATLAHAFESGFSTKAPERGLGLPLVLDYVKAHGGGMHIDSRPGSGTAVEIFLPCAARDRRIVCAAGSIMEFTDINQLRGYPIQLLRQSGAGVRPDGQVAATTDGAKHLAEGTYACIGHRYNRFSPTGQDPARPRTNAVGSQPGA